MSGETFKTSEIQGVTSGPDKFGYTFGRQFQYCRRCRIVCLRGMFRDGRGTGFWTFSPSENFRSDMKNRGYGYLNDEELMRAALTN